MNRIQGPVNKNPGSKFYFYPTECCEEPKPCKCQEPHQTTFNCANVSGATSIPIINILDSTPVPKTLGTVSIDLECFDKPKVKLSFSALVSFGAAIALGFTLTFRVFKRCGNVPETEIYTFDLFQGVAVAIGSTIPVSFEVCDGDFCGSDCCTYRVSVEGSSLLAAVVGTFNVTNGVLTVLATEHC